ncbi:protein-methionine-sulfoxide reductase heme-binding subunit MsrQ [Castellaniella sp.]|uniref:sulfite oxidase heme-binding subunit YedZ n=1 Tax=Castellaniella sp. TaxID=1955812 RepID=UPI002B000F62|nr:protein-methionine-sulfoxide reductase heme-binding subunit MsrQ [Castellaniella sp.]
MTDKNSHARQRCVQPITQGQSTARPQRHSSTGGRLVLGLCIHLFGLFPLVRWVVLGYVGSLSANPQEFLTRSSGIWALVFLWVTLAVTPVRRLTGWNGLLRQRRKLGLYAFFYTMLHVIAWALWDRGAVLAAMWTDIWQRDFIGIGTLATLCLVPLAVTSTHRWMRRLGRWWTRLHWLIYPAAIFSILHFIWMRAGKNDFFEPQVYAVVLVVMLGIRLAWRLWGTCPGRRSARH